MRTYDKLIATIHSRQGTADLRPPPGATASAIRMPAMPRQGHNASSGLAM